MAFLDNSGDIILDAVLTDTGRLRMAQGDGSFKISKFAVGDDEINYGLYNKNHLSGSAYYDLEVLQTPVLEAFTNNTSNLKTKLVTMSRTNVLYMPILKLNPHSIGINGKSSQNLSSRFFKRTAASTEQAGGTGAETTPYIDKYYIATTATTFEGVHDFRPDGETISKQHAQESEIPTTGVIQGFTAGDSTRGALIRVDQGLDTEEISVAQGLDTDLVETAFIVELDYRLGRVKKSLNHDVAPVNFIDDDNIATYYLAGSQWVDSSPAMTNLMPLGVDGQPDSLANLPNENPQVFGDGKGTGPRGRRLLFRIQASLELQQSTYLFTQLGTSQDLVTLIGNDNIAGLPKALAADDGFLASLADKKLHYIDSTVRIIGANTGYRLDIPIRYIKLT